MDDVVTDLRAYYDQDAHVRASRDLHGVRLDYRARFLDRLGTNQRLVLEVGCGPGKDAAAIAAAGHRYVGLDLSLVHAQYTRAAVGAALQGSLLHLPIATGSVDAAWTMSTYMHVPDAHIAGALDELVRVVRPGGLIGIGVWGGLGTERVLEDDHFDPPRFFALRHHDVMRELYAARGTIEHDETLPPGSDHWEYLFVILRNG